MPFAKKAVAPATEENLSLEAKLKTAREEAETARAALGAAALDLEEGDPTAVNRKQQAQRVFSEASQRITDLEGASNAAKMRQEARTAKAKADDARKNHDRLQAALRDFQTKAQTYDADALALGKTKRAMCDAGDRVLQAAEYDSPLHQELSMRIGIAYGYIPISINYLLGQPGSGFLYSKEQAKISHRFPAPGDV